MTVSPNTARAVLIGMWMSRFRSRPTRAEPAPPEANTLAGKLFVVDPAHPCAAEAADVVAAAGDHVCVDTPDVFARFRRAVTDTGLYKDSDRLAVKDDRRPLKQSEYLFQGDVSAKITIGICVSGYFPKKKRKCEPRH